MLLVLGRRPQQDSTVSCDKSEVCSCEGSLLTGRSFSFALRMLGLNFDKPIEHWVDSKKEYSQLCCFIHLFIYIYAGSYCTGTLSSWQNFPEVTTKYIQFDSICFTAPCSGFLSYLHGGSNCRSFTVAEVTVQNS